MHGTPKPLCRNASGLTNTTPFYLASFAFAHAWSLRYRLLCLMGEKKMRRSIAA
jgi:hypothetical protein